jgi:hypothetical protein
MQNHETLKLKPKVASLVNVLYRIWPLWVNFTNILRAAFLYESFAKSVFVLEVKVKVFIGARKLAQLRS